MSGDYLTDPLKYKIYNGEDIDVTREFKQGKLFVSRLGVLDRKFEKKCSITNMSNKNEFRSIIFNPGDSLCEHTPVGVYKDWEDSYWVVVVEDASKVMLRFVGECTDDVIKFIHGLKFR